MPSARCASSSTTRMRAGSMRLLDCGETHAEGRAPTQARALGLDRAALLLHQLLHDIEAEPGSGSRADALVRAAEEALEHVRELASLDPDAVVLHLDDGAFAPAAQPQVDAAVHTVLDVLGGVVDQVREDALERLAVGAHPEA